MNRENEVSTQYLPIDRTRKHDVVLLEPVRPGRKPDHCVHGRTTCVVCGDWCWLGDKSHDYIVTGKALPMCIPCGTKYVPAEQQPSHNLQDHRRADGPH